jgi:DMSO reductase family type II enzyme heme b subunit
VDLYPDAPMHATYRTAEAAGNLLAAQTMKSPVEDANARGFGTMTTQPPDGQNVQGRGVWSDGFWSVLFHRDLKSRDAEDVSLVTGQAVPVAFAIWNGAQRDRNGRKVVSNWFRLTLNP